jgi:hypothetical protein
VCGGVLRSRRAMLFLYPQNKLALPDDRLIFSFEQEGIIELRKEPEVAVAII